MTEARVQVSAKGLRRLSRRHPWVFASDLRGALPGVPGVVRLEDERGRVLGHGLYNPRSKLALRVLSWDEATLEPGLFTRRAEAALAYRERVRGDFEAYRLIHGEADGLPGLVVDRYAEHLVVQLHAAALEPYLPEILDVLEARCRPRGVLARHDSGVRALEGLPQEVAVLAGQVPESIPFREGGVTLTALPYSGQKTGAFLDQRENHVYAGTLSRGRALDVFSYHGGFALQLAGRAETVLAVDSSRPALEVLARGVAQNGFSNVETRRGNAFEVLRDLGASGERFDTIVLDPPAFAKGRTHLDQALAGYKDINLQALRLLAPNGRLITASCSYHVSDAAFQGAVAEAAADAGRELRLLSRRAAASCHPELLSLPESHYLKLLALEALG